MSAATAAGVSLWIGTTAPNALTDTYIEVGNVLSIPEFGRVYAEVKYNPLTARGVQKVKGSYDDGSITVQLAKDADDPGQAALLAARDQDFNFNFKIVANDAVAPQSAASVTMTAASPGVVTDTAHGLANGTPVKFTVNVGGVLPTGITAGTTYYVVGATTNTYNLAATSGGSAINTTGSPSGNYTRTTVPVPTTLYFQAQVLSCTTTFGTIDNVVGRNCALSIQSGSLTEVTHIP